MFRLILHELLATTPGAVAVIFLDWEGETVELVCDRNVSDHDLRIIGAYQGIFLSQLRATCLRVGAGAPIRFRIACESMFVMCYDIGEGYYFVMLTDASANEGISWRRMERCRQRLLEEM